ncbi:MAG: hypothetical protein PHX27_02885 [Candidatus ainarchaeum sp.]|nr:hypothetical protein [Candidatus ainarchaeum sp.]
MILDVKGQSGAVFRLMVDAIIGLVILLIILSVLTYFESVRIDVSKAEFISIVQSAVETPNGSVVASKTLVFVSGLGFSASQLQSLTNYPADCFKFQSNLGSVNIIADGKMVEFKQNVETKVYAKCEPDLDNPENIITCDISFGTKLD